MWFTCCNKQIKIDIMKNKLSPDWLKLTLQQKIYAMFQRTIQFSLHIFSCVSLKKDTTDKDLCEKEKCGKFEKTINWLFKNEVSMDLNKKYILRWIYRNSRGTDLVSIYRITKIDFKIIRELLIKLQEEDLIYMKDNSYFPNRDKIEKLGI